MSASKWGQFLNDPQSIYGLFDEEPDLDRSDLFHLLADERNDSITLGFETSQTPLRIKSEWEGREYNSFTFHLVFSGVRELSIRGWRAPARKRITIVRQADETLVITLTSEGTSVSFRARTASLSGVNVGLASR